jgi:hypothetical protein
MIILYQTRSYPCENSCRYWIFVKRLNTPNNVSILDELLLPRDGLDEFSSEFDEDVIIVKM